MSCSNCFNGCTEVKPTDCQKYTGPNVPELGINNGDSLTSLIGKITTIVLSTISGEGIVPNIDITDVCNVVKANLPSSGDITLLHFLNAIISAICSLHEITNGISAKVEEIEKSYEVCCLTDVDTNSNTHQVLQSVIKKLCSVSSVLGEFILDVNTNYVKKSELNGFIAEYLADQNNGSYKNRMVPFAVTEYYGPLDVFDITGKGTGLFTDIYLCNGNNGTPDKRGFTAVGATIGMGGGTLDPLVDPVSPGNPQYTLNGVNGQNTVALSVNQIPSHNHPATSTATSQPHSHHVAKDGPRGDINSIYPIVVSSNTDLRDEYKLRGTQGVADLFKTSETLVNVTVSTSVSATGGGQAHTNVQPSKGCYYIIYIPS